MICAECAEEVEEDLRRCPACGGEPLLAERLRIDAIEQIDALGTTYRATRVADALPVWLRELPFRRGPSDPGPLLEREAARLAELRHAVLPAWIEHFVRREGRAGALWLVQAQVDGTPLARLARTRLLDEADLLARLEPLADLLVYLHAQKPPVVHGGITPSSVIETEAGDLVLIGFNAIGTDREINPTTGSGVQTVARAMASMAPEQFFGRSEPATDVWALGLIAVVLLTGATPLELRDADHRLLWRKRVRVDPSLAELLDAMLHHDPGHRPRAPALRERIAGLRRTIGSTNRLARDEILRGRDRPRAVAGTIGERRSSEPDSPPRPARTQVIHEPRRPARQTRRSDSNDDVPVMRPADLSRELSQAQQATEQLLDRARRRATAARMTIVLIVALTTAAILWFVLLVS